jgi:transcriptional regulator with XRE-family HTH domain
MDQAKIIGQNIKQFRDKLGLTQEQIANLLNIDRSMVSHYENGEREISIVHLHKISDLFGIEIEDLLEKDIASFKANLSFAFRTEVIANEDIASIAAFQKVVKNYIKMKQLSNEQE